MVFHNPRPIIELTYRYLSGREWSRRELYGREMSRWESSRRNFPGRYLGGNCPYGGVVRGELSGGIGRVGIYLLQVDDHVSEISCGSARCTKLMW